MWGVKVSIITSVVYTHRLIRLQVYFPIIIKVNMHILTTILSLCIFCFTFRLLRFFIVVFTVPFYYCSTLHCGARGAIFPSFPTPVQRGMAIKLKHSAQPPAHKNPGKQQARSYPYTHKAL